MTDRDYKLEAKSIIEAADADAVEKLLKQIHELKRQQSELTAAARVAGYRDGEKEAHRLTTLAFCFASLGVIMAITGMMRPDLEALGVGVLLLTFAVVAGVRAAFVTGD